jgi:hypothetical protein
MFLLQEWMGTLFVTFGHHPYLVGSVARGEPWRDVDIRLMLDDDDPLLVEPRCQVLNVAMSLYGQRATGLPIDFQFQSITEGNNEPEPRPRNPVGVSAHVRRTKVFDRDED